MKYFYIPINLEKWNLFVEIKNIGQIDSFPATKRMKLNDKVIFYVGKNGSPSHIESGVYAWGEIVKEPYMCKEDDDYNYHKLWVDVRVEYISYEKPIINAEKNTFLQPYQQVHEIQKEDYDKVLQVITEENDKNNVTKEIENLEKEFTTKKFNVGEKQIMAKARIGQGTYKKLLSKKFDTKCCICNLQNTELLVGSHIKEWKDSNTDEKGDVNNGLLLCTLHDSLFDKHLISFDEKGKIMFSSRLSQEDKEILNLKKDVKIKISQEMEAYMKQHREKLKSREKHN